jgi:glycosyltransferase involved in cell wall biosynthesis
VTRSGADRASSCGSPTDEPLVTVVVAAYNYAHLLPDALTSLQRGTYKQWECIVVDDGSTDSTSEVVTRFAADDSRFRLVAKGRGGMVSCMNAACDEMSGQLVALLDADDLVLPDRITDVVHAFRTRPRAGLVIHRLFVTDSELRVVGVLPLARRLPEGDLSGLVRSRRTGILGAGITSNMALRSDVYRRIFPADPAIGNYPDALIRRLAPLYAEVGAINRVLGIRRLHTVNDSRIDTGGFLEHVRRAQVNSAALESQTAAALTPHETTRSANAWEPNYANLSHDYVLARLSRSNAVGVAEAKFFGADAFRNLPGAYRLYWQVVRRVPHRLLQPTLRLLYAPDGLKPVLQYARLHLGGRRWTRELGDLRRARLSTLLRHVWTGRW